MLFTNEYTFKTHRQNIIDGLSRNQFIDVKFALAIIFSLASTVLVIFTALIFGFATGTDFSLNGFDHVGYFFLKALSYNMIAILFSVLVKRTGFATGLFFIYLGGENFISFLLDSWGTYIKNTGGPNLGSLGDYLPMNASDGLLTFPRSNGKAIVENILPTNYTWVVLAFALFYLFIFIYWARRRFIKSDL